MKVTDSGHLARLQRLISPLAEEVIGEELGVAATIIAEDAAHSIRDGAISGPGHIASLPGEPPNADTHDLDASIHTGEAIQIGDVVKAFVIADSDHAQDMEFGNSRVAERPYLRPATERHRTEAAKRIALGLNRVGNG